MFTHKSLRSVSVAVEPYVPSSITRDFFAVDTQMVLLRYDILKLCASDTQ